MKIIEVIQKKQKTEKYEIREQAEVVPSQTYTDKYPKH